MSRPDPRFPRRALLLAPLLCACTWAQTLGVPPAPEWIIAGPMIGHVSQSRAQIWLQVRPGSRFRAEGRIAGVPVAAAWTKDLGSGCNVVAFEGLTPGTPMTVRLISLDDPGQRMELGFRTAPAPSDTGTVRLAFGSCVQDARYGRVPVFEAMAREAPDVALFVGDNSYFVVGDGGPQTWNTNGTSGDWSTSERMRARHLMTRTNQDLQALIRMVPSYATWDDHDYGPNNSDQSFQNRRQALRVFKQVWANPDYGTEAVSGVFSSFRWGPVEVFLMDCRYHKNVQSVDPDQATIWGEDQLQWLFRGLEASTAPVKIIANGTQFMNIGAGDDGDHGEGHYGEARGEYQRVLSYLAANRIDGVMFLTGDRHHSEFMQLQRDDGPDILEFTSSPIQQNQVAGPFTRLDHPARVWAMVGNSYGLVTISIPQPGTGTITVECRDESNQVAVIDGQPRRTTVDLAAMLYR